MKAAVCDRYGPPEVLRVCEVRRPSPRPDEVRIRILASAVTASDIFIRSAHVTARLQIPFRLMMGLTRPRHPIIGFVFSGVIDETGVETTRFQPGDEVYGATGFRLGAYAEYRCMIESDSRTNGCLALKPRNLSHQ
jgi:NADPH:quinone reductase-like Zn-dependent oxidoreductase